MSKDLDQVIEFIYLLKIKKADSDHAKKKKKKNSFEKHTQWSGAWLAVLDKHLLQVKENLWVLFKLQTFYLVIDKSCKCSFITFISPGVQNTTWFISKVPTLD